VLNNHYPKNQSIKQASKQKQTAKPRTELDENKSCKHKENQNKISSSSSLPPITFKQIYFVQTRILPFFYINYSTYTT